MPCVAVISVGRPISRCQCRWNQIHFDFYIISKRTWIRVCIFLRMARAAPNFRGFWSVFNEFFCVWLSLITWKKVCILFYQLYFLPDSWLLIPNSTYFKIVVCQHICWLCLYMLKHLTRRGVIGVTLQVEKGRSGRQSRWRRRVEGFCLNFILAMPGCQPLPGPNAQWLTKMQ